MYSILSNFDWFDSIYYKLCVNVVWVSCICFIFSLPLPLIYDQTDRYFLVIVTALNQFGNEYVFNYNFYYVFFIYYHHSRKLLILFVVFFSVWVLVEILISNRFDSKLYYYYYRVKIVILMLHSLNCLHPFWHYYTYLSFIWF